MTIRSLMLMMCALPLAAGAQQSAYAWAPAAPKASEAPLAPEAPRLARAITPVTDGFRIMEWSARFPQDPADSTYREARAQLNRGEWRRAAQLFGTVAGRQPASAYAADALYWQAFALYRIGGTADLRAALAALDARKSRFPRAEKADDAEVLATRVNGALAARGDASASERVRSTAAGSTAGGASADCDDEDGSVRAAALSTLMRNDPAAATPILLKVLDRRDACSTGLRRTALMILGRREDASVRTKLLDVARNDPERDIRATAIGYLAETDTDESAAQIDGLVRTEKDAVVQRAAVRTLGGMKAPKARSAIRSLVENSSAVERLRLDAIASFDPRAVQRSGYAYSYSCGDESCGQVGMTVPAIAPVAAVSPALPVVPAAPVSPTSRDSSRREREAERIRADAAERLARDEARMRTDAAERLARDEERLRADAAERMARDAERLSADAERMAASAMREFALAASTDALGFMMNWNADDRRISAEDAAWLRGVYPRLENARLKGAAASVLARAPDPATQSWVRELLQGTQESAEVRVALLAQLGRTMPIADLERLYDNAPNRSMRQQVVNMLGDRDEPAATDKLIDIAKHGTDPTLRRAAISALQGKKDPRTTQLLMELIDR